MKREIGEPDALRNNFYVIDFDRYRNRDGPAVEPTPAEPWVGASWEREDLDLWARRGDTIFNGSPPLSTLHLRKLALKKYKILDLEGNEVEHTLGFNKVMIDDEHIAILAAENDGVTPYGLIVYTI
ncbi:unnamed protein product [Rhizoctonia solani]|uniref:Uncharacterized protein n=1 Tax=Rhizoctonia solani TaxID=456999 RepID=A0A8H3CJI2_9AGAM|nr:unnamed protein product [Rhizoctonia solani]